MVDGRAASTTSARLVRGGRASADLEKEVRSEVKFDFDKWARALA